MLKPSWNIIIKVKCCILLHYGLQRSIIHLCIIPTPLASKTKGRINKSVSLKAGRYLSIICDVESNYGRLTQCMAGRSGWCHLQERERKEADMWCIDQSNNNVSQNIGLKTPRRPPIVWWAEQAIRTQDQVSMQFSRQGAFNVSWSTLD